MSISSAKYSKSGGPVKVSVVQSGNCTQNVSENVAMLLELSEQAAQSKPDLILLPELATTPYFAAGDKSP